MGIDYCIKQDDYWPKLRVGAKDANGDILSLTSATSASFYAVKLDRSATISGAASIYDAVNGTLDYNWGTIEGSYPHTPGDYRAEFNVSFEDHTTGRVPNNGYIMLRILSKVL